MHLTRPMLCTALVTLLSLAPATSFADECGDPSPTSLDGISLHEAHTKTELEPHEVRAAKQLLRQFKGDWEGHGVGVVCLGQGANTRERVKQFEIKGDGSGSRERGEIKLHLEHEGGNRTERLRLELNGNRLGTSNAPSSLVEVLSVGEDHVEWVYRYKSSAGYARLPLEARWYLKFSRIPGQAGQRATVEHRIYSLGGLASEGRWTLKRR